MTDAVHFSTTLSPHRSLSPEGFKWLIRGVLAANVVVGLPMYLLGAWPVAGFMGIDVWLLWFFFQRSYLDARRRETLTLTDRELIVERRSPDGEREEHRLDAYWLRFDVTGEYRGRANFHGYDIGTTGGNQSRTATLAQSPSCCFSPTPMSISARGTA